VLLDELGRGGMATVYRAHDEVLDRQVAIKVLHPHLATDEAFLDRFRREARAAAALSHPNVVAVHDWGESEEGAYLVLQLIEGPTLRQLLREHGQLSPEEAAGVLIPVARGSAPRTPRGWSTATSNRRTCSSDGTGSSASPTSGSHGRSPAPTRPSAPTC
jgi:eukaryotic-like serine/threonine-protein kinase